jgi:creatinine amidohydrolase
MMPKRFWREMPTTAFTECGDWIAVLPVAAIEQHGPHLPVGVDALIAEGMVSRAADALPADLLVTFLPIQEIAKSNEHVRFPGTLTIGWETVIRAWIDIGESVSRAGVRKLVIITSHGGNVAPMDIVARELRDSRDMLVITTSWGRLGRWQEVYSYTGPIADIHGGLSETSPMLVFRSDLVDMTKAKDFKSSQADMKARYQKLGWHGSDANAAWLAGDLNPEGPVGDAAAADAALGQREIDHEVEGFVQLMREVHDMAAPEART